MEPRRVEQVMPLKLVIKTSPEAQKSKDNYAVEAHEPLKLGRVREIMPLELMSPLKPRTIEEIMPLKLVNS